MRIGIDARMYGPLTRGIGRYIKETILQLEELDTINEYVIFLYSENFNDYTPKNSNFKKVLAPWKWYTLKEQVFFPILIQKYNVDIMHFPHFNVPLLYNKPYIVTIHDLILMQDTQERATTLGPIKYKIKKLVYRQIIKHAVKKAIKIIGVSQHTSNDIHKLMHIPFSKIKTIHEGISGDKLGKKQIDNIYKKRYNYKKPYIIYVGSAYPHKNLEKLINVIDDINKTRELNLLLVGKKDFFYKRLEDENSSKHIKFLGFIPDRELSHLFQESIAYIFPSRYEGFGLPPLEAMLQGCPVISSNASCLPEILGDAAIYFDPSSNSEMKDAILGTLNNPQLREELTKKGYEQVKKYSWKNSTKKTHQLYINSL